MTSSIQLTVSCQQRIATLAQDEQFVQIAKKAISENLLVPIGNEKINIDSVNSQIEQLNEWDSFLTALEKVNIYPEKEYIMLTMIRILLSIITLSAVYWIWKFTIISYQNKQLENGLISMNANQVLHAIKMGASNKIIFDKLATLDEQFLKVLAEKGVTYSPTEEEEEEKWNNSNTTDEILEKMTILSSTSFFQEGKMTLLKGLYVRMFEAYLLYEKAKKDSNQAAPATHGKAQKIYPNPLESTSS